MIVPFPSFALLVVSDVDLEICVNMVQRITTVIKENQDKLREMPYVPKTSFERVSLEFCGETNKLFLTFLYSYHAIGLQFLNL
jgi:hypothetical protein